MHLRSTLAALFVLGCSAGVEPTTATPNATEAPLSASEHAVAFQTGWSFAKLDPADSITIDGVVGDHDAFVVGGTYRVAGHYQLHSLDSAEISVLVTNGHADEGPRSSVRVTRGSGTFELRLTILAAGYPHVTFYPEQGGTGFAGIYFGQGEDVLREGW